MILDGCMAQKGVQTNALTNSQGHNVYILSSSYCGSHGILIVFALLGLSRT